MRLLYAIQGTGNGHVSRAREIIPHLLSYGAIDVLISGTHSEIQVGLPVLYQLHGMGFQFGKSGGISISHSIKSLRPVQFLKDIRSLPIQQYDMVLNDFEPVSAYAAKKRGVPIHALSHQAAFLSKLSPRPGKPNMFAEWLFRNYAPCGSYTAYHFQKYDQNIHTPVIRAEVRALQKQNTLDHITVYLPAYESKRLIPHFTNRKEVQWHLFSKHDKLEHRIENVWIRPLNNWDYLHSMSSAIGLLTGGGFEAPAEALFLGKKLLVVPMQNQYEQQCNAAALAQLGVTVIPVIKDDFASALAYWLKFTNPIQLDYPDETAAILSNILAEFK